MHADLRMIVAERLPVDVQRRAIQRRGAVLLAAIGIQAGQLVHHRGRVRSCAPAVRPIDAAGSARTGAPRRRSCRAAGRACACDISVGAISSAVGPSSSRCMSSAAVRRCFALCKVAAIAQRIAERAQCDGHGVVSRTVDGNLRLQPFFQQRDRVRVETETLVHRADRAEQRRARLGLIREPEADAPRADVEQLARRDLVAAAARRIGELEQLDEERRDLLRARALGRGDVALVRDALRLHESDRRERRERDDRRSRRGDRELVPADELARAIQPGVLRGEHRLAARDVAPGPPRAAPRSCSAVRRPCASPCRRCCRFAAQVFLQPRRRRGAARDDVASATRAIHARCARPFRWASALPARR